MAKAYSADDDKIKHWVMPEVRGRIVGDSGKDAVRPQTVEDIEALQKQAYDEARIAGHKAGLADIQAKAAQMQKVIRFLEAPLDNLDEEVESQLTELALTVARVLLKQECATDPSLVQKMIHQSLEFLPVHSRQLRVKLNPADIALLKEAEIDIESQSWTCVADKSISQGGCMVESDQSHIDATLETRIQQVVDQLTEHRPHYDGETE
jgi:flagellar assembly protein FliH